MYQMFPEVTQKPVFRLAFENIHVSVPFLMNVYFILLGRDIKNNRRENPLHSAYVEIYQKNNFF